MKSKFSIAIILIALVTYACQAKYDNTQSADEVAELNRKIDKTYKELADSTRSFTNDQKDDKQAPTNPDWDKKIIKNASLTVEVKDYKAYSNNLISLVKKFGGYVANEQETQSEERLENRVKIKVPVAQFQDLMTALNNSSDKVDNKQISSEDVTTEVVDTKSRIEAKKKIRQRYLDFLSQAKTMQDILSIQREINGIQEEIEMAEGRVDYLTHFSAYSSIELYYFQQLKAPSEESAPTFSTKVSTAFKGGWEVLKELFVVVITVWPLWIIILAGIFFYKKRKVPAPVKTTL